MSGLKSFEISKYVVWEAYLKVKANGGTAGVDGESIERFEADLRGSLYKLWNRLSSGSYFPPPVRMVEIPKPGGSGKVRVLGVPTVADRIAQTAAAMVLEPEVEPMFHPDSYGYRPGRSALDAVAACRERCWRTDWTVDIDIQGFFDNLDHDLVLKAVAHHTDQRWILLYVERWLKAPLRHKSGELVARDRGSPQGSAISPLLANLFMHYAFDTWMDRVFPGVRFERYCDDMVVHCRTEAEAHQVRQAIGQRLAECGGLRLHPDKTRIVYCKDGKRRGSYEHVSFTFLGYTFRSRKVRSRTGSYFFGFNPAISDGVRFFLRDEKHLVNALVLRKPRHGRSCRSSRNDHVRTGHRRGPSRRNAPSATRRPSASGRRSADGGCTCAVGRPWQTLHGRSIPSCGDGSATTGGSIRPRWSRA
ncbi:group II intron reverse transcriptase/maturase [Streptomyces sp. NBC_01549]|uniref:group II intron reverse transcriptase/maturase n=1 Tax=Streptomyces sp. NBC_01549 TaxID=2975874 RepID=UPI00224F6D86|nr:group II intron reverse transcriptase/maturase [Streptomyces sp. NBC_01549]MCX4598883.1 group II intron reverse transcriptase/maturase [Streptomyces sp. NBC_01549]